MALITVVPLDFRGLGNHFHCYANAISDRLYVSWHTTTTTTTKQTTTPPPRATSIYDFSSTFISVIA